MIGRYNMQRTIGALFAIAILLSAGATRSNATEVTYVNFDGVWWQGLTRVDKLLAVQGMLVGYHGGYSDAGSDTWADCRAAMQLPPSQCDGQMKRLNLQEPSFSDRSFGTIADRIDSVYENHPRLVKWRVANFVSCAAKSGENCEGLARYLETYKGNPD
jgi:hypothetical protein